MKRETTKTVFTHVLTNDNIYGDVFKAWNNADVDKDLFIIFFGIKGDEF